jgi:GMP synthase-like glutamine amidotransferase
MNVGDDASHPWLREELAFLHRVVELQMPVIGLCLGAQLLARAMNSAVFDAAEPEIGWYEVETTQAASADPVCARLPARFHAFQWHAQTHALPPGATVLARNRIGIQAYRVGNAWGMQFHPELTEDMILEWLSHDGWPVPENARAIAQETSQRIDGWNALGHDLCAAFLDVAQVISIR